MISMVSAPGACSEDRRAGMRESAFQAAGDVRLVLDDDDESFERGCGEHDRHFWLVAAGNLRGDTFSMTKETPNIDTDFPASGAEPFRDFTGILRRMQEAGLVNGVEHALSDNAIWASRLQGEDASHLAETRARLAPLSRIELEFGHGACLDLDHEIVKDLIKWQRIDDVQLANAAAFTASGRTKELHQARCVC
ncbi:hypothetical protein E0H47_25300 [Rhizobium leguminosarum bv. viciae]|jgi:hypothetical protein|uniref:hypothetical protein n=1 Tax=Rhizobium leguminosarum TaxID=384 RepID=UPI00103BFFF0|nr:hypothetical protein [Rhizobium leguminosarum]TBZ35064.1 hypothetical protein E0H47_25300 [Rhizobium leguminosarum bv. viciae]